MSEALFTVRLFGTCMGIAVILAMYEVLPTERAIVAICYFTMVGLIGLTWAKREALG